MEPKLFYTGPVINTEMLVVMLEKHGIACDMRHGLNWDKWTGKMTNDE